VEHDPDLKEHDIGEVSGLSPREIGERYPELIAARRKGVTVLFPGEEPREAFTTRVRGVIDRLAAQDGTTVVVSHGGVVGAAAHYVLGADGSRRGYFSTDNCSITEIVRDRTGRLVLLRFNDTCHLGALSTDFDGG
jgi:probable phosphoglycerate mutase